MLFGGGSGGHQLFLPVNLLLQESKGEELGSLGQVKPKRKHGRKMVWAVFRARDKEFLEGLNWVLCHKTAEDSRNSVLIGDLGPSPACYCLGGDRQVFHFAASVSYLLYKEDNSSVSRVW